MKIAKKLLIIGIAIVACVLLGIGAFLGTRGPAPTPHPTFTPTPSPTPTPTPSLTYSSTFCLLFEDELHNLLGNLTGELRLILGDKTVNSKFHFALSSFRQNQPYIETVQILTTYNFYVYDGQGPEIMLAPPLPQNITIHVYEQTSLFNLSTDISSYEEPMVLFGFARDPTVWIYLSNGEVCTWKAQQDVDSSFPLWSGGHEWRLSELIGKSETATTTITLPIKITPTA
ncbi:MAG: hypothetical protein ACUVUE_05810 [Candidatus Bathycorpusculaceae bacterium]